AMGVDALGLNADGVANVAVGDAALSNANATFNTAVGFAAGQNVVAGDGNIYIGADAGTFDAPGDESGTIRIGDSVNSSAACFIQGIAANTQPIGGTVMGVTVDTATGQLGVDVVGGSKPSVPRSAPGIRSKPQPRSAPQRSAAQRQ